MTALLGAPPGARAQTPIWTKTFDYAGGNEALPAKIALDNAGNIIVANSSGGNSLNSDYNYDFTVSKYNASGTKLWTGKFDSPDTGVSGVASGDDMVTGLTVDSSNNVYVIGSSQQGSYDKQWATVKFNGIDGTQLWVRTEGDDGNDFPVGIARDSAQNVYVVGSHYVYYADPNSAIYLVKYTPSGGRSFSTYFDAGDVGLGNSYLGDTQPRGMVVDGAGNATIVGYSYQNATRKIDAIVCRSDAEGYFTWAKAYDAGRSGDDGFNAIARDTAGNVYAAGYTTVSATNNNTDALLVKYAPDGTQTWVRTVDGTNFAGVGTSRYDTAEKVIVDGSSNVYMAGTVTADAANADVFVAKYNGAGDLLWRDKRDYHGYADSVSALARDSYGDMYVGVTAQANATSTDLDWQILKYSTGGTLIAAPVYDRASKKDGLGDIVFPASSSRDIYVVGTGEAATGGDPFDLIIRRYAQAATDPTIQAFDMSVGQDNKPRILWNRLSGGGITLWTVTPTGTPDNGKVYSLPVGWSPVCQTTGSDNKLRFLLRYEATGQVAIWTFSANILTLETGVLYGPVTGYTARDLSISPDGRKRLVWEQATTKRIALWTLPVSGSGVQSGVYVNPPAVGYTFRKLSVGDDGIVRLLWANPSGAACLTTMNAANTAAANNKVYTLSNYLPFDLSVGNDNKARILWSDENGSIRITRYIVAGSAADGAAIALGSYANLNPVSLWMGKGDNKARVMWRYDDGRMTLMRLTTAGAIEQQNTYGPY